MFNRIGNFGALNQLGGGLPAAQLLNGLEGAALSRLGGLGINAAGPNAFATLQALEANAAAAGVLNWAQQTLANLVAPGAGAAASATPGAPSAPGDPEAPGEMQKGKDSSEAQGNDGEWGAEDEKYLEQDVQKAATPGAGAGGGSGEFNNLFNDFGQTSEGNCATVAVMKAALDKYGTHVFQSVSRSGDGFQVRQQDGKTVSVSNEELRHAAQAAKLKGKPSAAKSMAVLMYAVVGKNEGSVESLGQGADPKKIAQDLGLGSKVKDVSVEEAGQAKEGAVAWSGDHAIYESNGKADHYGKAVQADGTDTNGGANGPAPDQQNGQQVSGNGGQPINSGQQTNSGNGPQPQSPGGPADSGGANANGAAAPNDQGGTADQGGKGQSGGGGHKLEGAFEFI